jgi:hypothetical protein
MQTSGFFPSEPSTEDKSVDLLTKNEASTRRRVWLFLMIILAARISAGMN